MEKKLTAELKALKEEFDFIHKKIGDLEWERAIRFYGKKAVLGSDIDKIDISGLMKRVRFILFLLLNRLFSI